MPAESAVGDWQRTRYGLNAVEISGIMKTGKCWNTPGDLHIKEGIAMTSTAVNKELPLALYYQIEESIRNKILTKEWKAGSKIPTETEICKMYGVSRITVRKALEALQQEGYLEKIQGKGNFVLETAVEQKLSKFYSFSEELYKKGLKENTCLLSFRRIHAEADIARPLNIRPGMEVFEIIRSRFVDETPYAYECSYIPVGFGEGLTGEMITSIGLYKSLNLFDTYLDSAREEFRAINLSAEVAEILHTVPGEAAMSLLRTTYSGFRAVEYCKSVVRGDFFSYSVELK